MKHTALTGHPIPRSQRGFGLVEMMVALVLGLLVVGAASVMFISTRRAGGTTENLSRVQESVRTSYDLMSREVREAGGTPCDAGLLVGNVLNNAQTATPTWWGAWTEPLMGVGGGTAFDGAAFGSAVAERVSGTDAIMVRYAAAVDDLAVTAHDTATTVITTNRTNHGISAGQLVMVCNYRQAAIFEATAVNTTTGTVTHANTGSSPGNCSKGLGVPTDCTATGTTYQFASGSLIGRLNVVGWYIGNNGRAETGGRSLYRVTRSGPEEVAEGVRDMQLTYLINGGSDYVADSSVTDWSQVTAVRFDMTYESPETGVTAASAAERLTRTVGFTVNLRNLMP